MGMNTGTGSYRLYTSRSYGNRRRGLTGNQLKVLGIVAILIDNVGAVLIQGGILHAADRTLYQAMIATRSGHIWMIAGQACRYMGRLAFPIFAFLVAEEFVRTRERGRYALRMLLCAVVSEVPFDLAVYHREFYPYYQKMQYTLRKSMFYLLEAVRPTGCVQVLLLFEHPVLRYNPPHSMQSFPVSQLLLRQVTEQTIY